MASVGPRGTNTAPHEAGASARVLRPLALLGGVLIVYCGVLFGAGITLAASSFGISGPPMPATASPPRGL